MDICGVCGIQADKLPFTIFYNESAKEWELGPHVCADCVRQVTTEQTVDEREEEESERFHAWADTQR